MMVQFIDTKPVDALTYIDLLNVNGVLYTMLMRKYGTEGNDFGVARQEEGDHRDKFEKEYRATDPRLKE